jgi:hypothetical protein
MYARMVTGQIMPEKLDDIIQIWADSIGPEVKKQKGFLIARLMVDRQTNKVVSVGLWMSEADVLNSAKWNRAQIDKFNDYFVSPPTVEIFEVMAEAERVI